MSLQSTKAGILPGTALIARGVATLPPIVIAFDLPICFDCRFKSSHFVGGNVSVVGNNIVNGSRTFSFGTDGIGLQFTFGSNSRQAAISIPAPTAEALALLNILASDGSGGFVVAPGVEGIVTAYYS